MKLFSGHKLILLTYITLILFGACTFNKEKSEEAVSEKILPHEEELGQLISIGLQQIPKWGGHWKNVAPEFDFTQFKLNREIPVEMLEWPEENFIQPGNPFFKYLISHPEGHGVVDIYSYKVVIPEDDKVSFNPDSEVIYFKSNGMRQRLLFMGPSGGFEEAVWISPDHLLVSGFFEEEEGVTPKIWLILPEEETVYTFNHPLHTTQYPKTMYLKEKLSNIDF